MNTSPIKCPECTSLMENPCPTLVALFSLKQAIEIQNLKGADAPDKQVQQQLEKIDESIKNTGVQDSENLFKKFKALMPNESFQTSRFFVLKCIKGHVNTFELNCNN